ncbi:hypothetical protein EI94DRAFT_1009151 [Lactarius quietus]|nr:hypothetical protein EI94DRAFT_1009151 [Lactarius quietus]
MSCFPPMVVPHGSRSGAPGSAPAHSPTISSSPPSSTPEATTRTTTGDTPHNETALDMQGTRTQDGNTVVPAIVVGLQSVQGHGHVHAQGQGHRHAEGRDEHPPLPPPLLPQQDLANNDNEHVLQDEVVTESPWDREREHRWSTRAADALHGFRPVPGAGTARHESLGPGSGGVEGGARTGDDGHRSTNLRHWWYYPPNHQLVTGTYPLDSFDELAELLGQVKPPTATKEDINKSGLEVIVTTPERARGV